MNFVHRLSRIHSTIAADLHSHGERYTLSCEKCKRVEECTQDAFSVYLSHGWPKCCGMTMTLEKETK